VDLPILEAEDCLAQDEVLEDNNQLVAFGMVTRRMYPRAALRKGDTVYWVVHRIDRDWAKSAFGRSGTDFLDYEHALRDLNRQARGIIRGTR
jgi:hypothetical protein